MSKALTVITTYLSNSKKNMSRILSATATERATKKLHRALATESEDETPSCSFQSSSSPTMHGESIFSGAKIYGGQFNISINTVN